MLFMSVMKSEMFVSKALSLQRRSLPSPQRIPITYFYSVNSSLFSNQLLLSLLSE